MTDKVHSSRNVPNGYRTGTPEEVEYWLADPDTVLIPASQLGIDGCQWVMHNPAFLRIIERREQMKRRGETTKCN